MMTYGGKMKTSRFNLLWVAMTMVVFLISCNSGNQNASSASTTEVPVVKAEQGIVAEGRIVPNKSVDLSFQVTGKVIEVLVNEGDNVKTGDVLARLGDREQVEAEVAQAEVELLNAQQALDNLIKNHPVDRAKALEAVAAANDKVRDAKYQLDNFTIPVGQQGLDAVEAVALMEKKLDQARAAFEPYKNDSLLNESRRKLKEALDNAQSDYNAAVKRLNYEVQLEAAKAELQRAMDNWMDIKDGPDPDQLALAENRVKAARVALDAAVAHLNNLDLKATIDGTVARIDLIVGDQVTPNVVVATIADFSAWYVETDNLTEIEVVDISTGQNVTVVPDAIPDLTLNGKVEKISQVFEEKRGDVTYTTKILLTDMDPRLRWGMTVLVTFVQ
jgi:HlyD family secretion protein